MAEEGKLVKLTWRQLGKLAGIWHLVPSIPKLRVTVDVRQGEEFDVTRDQVVEQLSIYPDFKTAVAGLEPSTANYWVEAAKFVSAEGAKAEAAAGEFDRQPTPDQLAEWERLAQKMADEQGISVDEARGIILRGQGKTAGKYSPQTVVGKLGQTPKPSFDKKTAGEPSGQPRKSTTQAIRLMEERAGREKEAGVWSFSEQLRHPSIVWDRAANYFRGYLRFLGGRRVAEGELETAANVAGQSARQPINLFKSLRGWYDRTHNSAQLAISGAKAGARKLATKAATKLGLKAALAVIPTGVTNVIGGFMLLKDALNSQTLKNLASKVAVFIGRVILEFLLHPLATALGALGLAFGGPLAFILAPAGFAFGLGLESTLSGLLGSGGSGASVATTITAPATAPLGTTLVGPSTTVGSAATGTVGSILSSTGLLGLFGGGPVIVSVVTVLAVSLMTLVATFVAFLSPALSSTNVFSLSKTANPSHLDNLAAGASATITYQVIITPAGGKEIEIQKVDENISVTGLNPKIAWDQNPSDLKVISTPTTLNGTLTIDPSYNNSRIVNSITITAITKGDNPTSQTQTASAVVSIGTVPEDTPYGIPVSGLIESLDDHYYWLRTESGGRIYKQHCGEVLHDTTTPYRCIPGGIDIAGGSAVFSTTTGSVVYSNFDCRLGGVVYIDSVNQDTGHRYRAAFMHMNKSLPAIGMIITRGQQIGTIYNVNVDNQGCPSGLTFETGSHLHYQVLRDMLNVKFSDQTNAGVCRLAGKRTDYTESQATFDQIVTNGWLKLGKDYDIPVTQTTECPNQ